MKRLLLNAAITLCAIGTTHAQESSTYNSSGRAKSTQTSFAHRDGLHITANLGIGSGGLANNNLSDFGGVSLTEGPMVSLGLELSYMFNNHFGVGLGLQSAAFGYTVDLHPPKTDIIQSYVGIPIYARVVTSKPGRLGYFANGGFAYNALSAISEKDQNNNEYTGTDGYRKNAFALQLFTGICIPAGNRVSFDLGLNYVRCLTGNFDADKVDVRGNLEYIGGKLALNIRLTK